MTIQYEWSSGERPQDYYEHGTWFVEKIPNWIHGPGMLYVVARDLTTSEIIAGYALYDYHPEYESIGMACALAGRLRREWYDILMTHLFEVCAVNRVNLVTPLDNLKAQWFLKRMGAAGEGLMVDYFGPGHHAIQYRLLRADATPIWDKLRRPT